MSRVEVSNDELGTVRDAMRELNRMVESLEAGDLEKVVLIQRNQMNAVVMLRVAEYGLQSVGHSREAVEYLLAMQA